MALVVVNRWHTYVPDAPKELPKLPTFEKCLRGRKHEPLYLVLTDLLENSNISDDERMVLNAVYQSFDRDVIRVGIKAWDQPYVIKELYQYTYPQTPLNDFGKMIARLVSYSDIRSAIIGKQGAEEGLPDSFFNRATRPITGPTLKPISLVAKTTVRNNQLIKHKGPQGDPTNSWGSFDPEIDEGNHMQWNILFPYTTQLKMRCCHEYVGQTEGCWMCLDPNQPLGTPLPYKVFTGDYWNELVAGDTSNLSVIQFREDFQVGTAFKDIHFYSNLHIDIQKLLPQAANALVNGYTRYITRLESLDLNDDEDRPYLDPFEVDLTSAEHAVLVSLLDLVSQYNQVHNDTIPGKWGTWSEYINKELFKTNSVLRVWNAGNRNVIIINGKTITLLGMSSVSDTATIDSLSLELNTLNDPTIVMIRNKLVGPYRNTAQTYLNILKPVLDEVIQIQDIQGTNQYELAFYNDVQQLRQNLIAFQRQVNLGLRTRLKGNALFDVQTIVQVPLPLTLVPEANRIGGNTKTVRINSLVIKVIDYAKLHDAPPGTATGQPITNLNNAILKYQQFTTNLDDSNISNDMKERFNAQENALIAAERAKYQTVLDIIEKEKQLRINTGNAYVNDLDRKQQALTLIVKSTFGNEYANVTKEINAQTKSKRDGFTSVTDGVLQGWNATIANAKASFDQVVQDQVNAVNVRIQQLRDDAIAYINKMTEYQNATSMADIDIWIKGFKAEVSSKEIVDLLPKASENVIRSYIVPFEMIHDGVNANPTSGPLQKYLDYWSLEINQRFWYTQVKQYLLELAQGLPPTPLAFDQTLAGLAVIARAFETADQRNARLALVAREKNRLFKQYDAWIKNGAEPGTVSEQALAELVADKSETPPFPIYKSFQNDEIIMLNAQYIFDKDALYVEGYDTKQLLKAYNAYATYLAYKAAGQDGSKERKIAIAAFKKIPPIPLQPVAANWIADPSDYITVQPRQPPPAINSNGSMFSFTAPGWVGQSCWLDSSMISLFSIPQASWTRKLFDVDKIYQKQLQITFTDGSTKTIKTIEKCDANDARNVHQALLEDIENLQRPTTSDKQECRVRLTLSKAGGNCLKFVPIAGQSESPDIVYELFDTFYRNINLGIEFVKQNGSLIRPNLVGANVNAYVIDVSRNEGNVSTFNVQSTGDFKLGAIVTFYSGHYTTFIYDFASKRWAYFNVAPGGNTVGWVNDLAKSTLVNGLPQGIFDWSGITDAGTFNGYRPAFFVFFRNSEIQVLLNNFPSKPFTPAIVDLGTLPSNPTPDQSAIITQHTQELKGYNGPNVVQYTAERRRIAQLRLQLTLQLTPPPPPPVVVVVVNELGPLPSNPSPQQLDIINQHTKEIENYTGLNRDEYVEERKRIVQLRIGS